MQNEKNMMEKRQRPQSTPTKWRRSHAKHEARKTTLINDVVCHMCQILHFWTSFPTSHPKALPQRETGCSNGKIPTLHPSTVPHHKKVNWGDIPPQRQPNYDAIRHGFQPWLWSNLKMGILLGMDYTSLLPIENTHQVIWDALQDYDRIEWQHTFANLKKTPDVA